MTLAAALLRAPRIGAREFRNKACSFINMGKAYLIAEHGHPAGVFLPYGDALELVDVIDELNDKKALKMIAEGRQTIRKGAHGVLLSDSLKKRGMRV
jgi:hypothetical protein